MAKAKKALSLFLSVLLVFMMGAFALPSLKTMADAGFQTVYFYVPECVYTNPNDTNSAQWYLNSYLSPWEQYWAAPYEGLGRIAFYCPGATYVNISCSASVYNFDSPTVYGDYIRDDEIYIGSCGWSGNIITWTATYVVDGVTKTARSYTYVYAPNRIPTVAASETESKKHGSSKYDYMGTVSVLWGSQWYDTADNGGVPYATGPSSMIYLGNNGMRTGNNDRPGGCGYFDGSNSDYFTAQYHNNNNVNCDVTTPRFYIRYDSSRIGTFNWIPNFWLGLASTDDQHTDYHEYEVRLRYGNGTELDYWFYQKATTETVFMQEDQHRMSAAGISCGANAWADYQMYIYGRSYCGGTVTHCYHYMPFSVNNNYKGDLRNLYLGELAQSYNRQQGNYTWDSWNNYANAMVEAARYLGAPDCAWDSVNWAYWNLVSARDNLQTTIYFNSNGANSSVPSSSAVYTIGGNGSINYDASWNIPSRTGYTYKGWSTASNAASGADTVNVTFNQTVYATWEANAYTVTFNGNGGNTEYVTKTVYYDSAYGSLPTASRVGYNFNGWFTASSGGTQVTDSTILRNAANHTLYAQWNVCPHSTKNYSAGNGVQHDWSCPACAATGTDNCSGGTRTCTSYAVCAYCNTAYGELAPHVFTNTRTDADYLKKAATCLAPAEYYYSCANCTAKDTANSFTSGNALGHNWGSLVSVSDTMHMRVCTNDATHIETGDHDIVTTVYPATTKNDKYTVYSCSLCNYTKTVTEDGTQLTVTVSFINDGEVYDTVTGYYGDELTAPAAPVKEGYTFGGWQNVPAVFPDADASCNAVWTANEYQVVYNGNGADSGEMSADTFVYDTAYTLSANAFTKTGYTFTGWNTEADGSGTAYADSAEGIKNLSSVNGAQIVLYAQWKINTYSVKFIVEGETVSEQTVDYGSDATAPADPEKAPDDESHYTFETWDSDFTNVTENIEVNAVFASAAHNEDVKTENISTATCKEDGSYYSIVYCTDCDKELSRETVTVAKETIAHKGGTADCTKQAVCEVCGQSYGDIGAHSPEYVPAVAPSCLNSGHVEYWHCAVCGVDFEDESCTTVLAAYNSAHDYGEWNEEIAATCNTEGVKGHYECSVCGHWFDADKNELDDLTIAFDPDNHADYGTHTEQTKAPTCKELGSDNIVCNGCNVVLGTADIALDPDNHAEYGTHKEQTKTPTCKELGSENIICNGCNVVLDVADIALDPDNHAEYGTHKEQTKAPTCKELGSENIVCNGCNVVLDVADIELDPDNHAEYGTHKEQTKAPTCKELGSDNIVCNGCNVVLDVADIALDPDNHAEYGTHKEQTKAPTCKELGSDNIVCNGCNAVLGTADVAVDPNNHSNYGTYEELVKAPTCITEGTKNHHCNGCDAVLSNSTVAMTEHPYGDCMPYDAVSHMFECTYCGKIQKADHVWDDGVVTVEPTDTQSGEKVFTCTECGTTKTTQLVPTGNGETDGKLCPRCGFVHKYLIDRILCVFRRIIKFIKNLFGAAC